MGKNICKINSALQELNFMKLYSRKKFKKKQNQMSKWNVYSIHIYTNTRIKWWFCQSMAIMSVYLVQCSSDSSS